MALYPLHKQKETEMINFKKKCIYIGQTIIFAVVSDVVDEILMGFKLLVVSQQVGLQLQ